MLRRQFITSALAAPFLANAAQDKSIRNLTADGAVNNPYGLRIGPDGALYICEIGNHRVSRLDLKTHAVAQVVGGQKEPYELQFDHNGDLLFVDMPAHVVRRFEKKSGTLITIAGTGEPGFSGDGGPAAKAQLHNPHSIALDRDGRLLICDIGNHRIRRVRLDTGVIDTFAGTGEHALTPDGAPVEGTPLNGPRAIAFDREGNLNLVLREGNAVYRIERGRFRHVAGTGEKGYSGDGGDARQAKLSGPKAISCAADGSIWIADTESHTIRRIDTKGIITTIVGTGERGDGPAGDPLKCRLSRPHGVYADKSGVVYISDSESHRIRLLA
jgi:streptogramin lyase